MKNRPINKVAVIILWIIALVYLAINARNDAIHTNTNIDYWDQSAIITLAKEVRESGNYFITDANRHPLFAWILSPLIGMGEDAFVYGKILSFILFLLLFVGLFLLLKNNSLLANLLFLLMFFLPAYVPLFAITIAPDILFSLLNGLSIALLIRSYKDVRFAAYGGAVAGLAYLCKYSSLLLLISFLSFQTIIIVYSLIRKTKHSRANGEFKRMFFATIFFLVVASPLMIYNMRTHGNPIYNVNATYYFWTNSWKEAKEFSSLSKDREPFSVHAKAMAKIPHANRPSMYNYVKSHSLGYMVFKLMGGARIYRTVLFSSRIHMLIIVSIVFLFLLFRHIRIYGIKLLNRRLISREGLFVVCYLMLSLFTLSWYGAVAVNIRYLFPVWIVFCVAIPHLVDIREKSASPD